MLPAAAGLRRGLAVDFPAEQDNRISLALFRGRVRPPARETPAGPARRGRSAARSGTAISRQSRASPRSRPLCNNLAWLLAGRPEAPQPDPIRAVGLAKDAVALAPTVGTYWNTLGVAHYRRRRPESRGRRARGVDAAPIRRRRLRLAVLGHDPPAARRPGGGPALVRPLPCVDRGERAIRPGAVPFPAPRPHASWSRSNHQPPGPVEIAASPSSLDSAPFFQSLAYRPRSGPIPALRLSVPKELRTVHLLSSLAQGDQNDAPSCISHLEKLGSSERPPRRVAPPPAPGSGARAAGAPAGAEHLDGHQRRRQRLRLPSCDPRRGR